MLQYGRVNIEAHLKQRSIYDDCDGGEAYSEKLSNLKQSSLQSLEQNSVQKVVNSSSNGHVTQQNGNTLITRDDNLILVPEPSIQPQKNETKMDDPKLSDDEADKNDIVTVSYFKLTFFKL